MKNFEIERKFLVKHIPNLENCKNYYIKQGYISTNPVLRIRQKDNKYIFTFKGKGDIQREEFEKEITKEEFENLWLKIEGEPIIKTRYIIPLENDLVAELDIYEGNLQGFKNIDVPTFEGDDDLIYSILEEQYKEYIGVLDYATFENGHYFLNNDNKLIYYLDKIYLPSEKDFMQKLIERFKTSNIVMTSEK